MDPNATYAIIKDALVDINAAIDRGSISGHDAVAELAQAIGALDQWLSQGGFPPEAWQGIGWTP